MRKRGTTRTVTDVTKFYSPTLFDARKEEVTLREGISIDTFLVIEREEKIMGRRNFVKENRVKARHHNIIHKII